MERVVWKLGFILLFIAMFIFMHEIAHHSINKLWDCKSEEIVFNWFAIGIKVDTNQCEGDMQIYRLAQSIPDSLAYTFMLPITILITLKILEDD